MNRRQFKLFVIALVMTLGLRNTPLVAGVSIAADYTGDQKVDLADFAALSGDWHTTSGVDRLDRLAFCWLMDATADAGVIVQTVYTDKSRYTPGQTGTITAICKNNASESYQGHIRLCITHNGHIIYQASQTITMNSSQSVSKVFGWTVPTADFTGYLVEIWLDNGSCAVTAIDVSSDWKRYPRYGYVTEFYSSTSTSRNAEIINALSRNYHINSLQYYDWMWRHERVIERNDSNVIVDPWLDWRGAAISCNLLRDSVGKAHTKAMAAMPYFQVYLALDDYETISSVSPEWGLYSDTGHASQYKHCPGVNMWLFDPGNVNWQNHLCSQYTDALTTIDWDGIHLDQLGDIGNGVYYNFAGGEVVLDEALISMVNRTKDHLDYLETIDSDFAGRDALLFNLVDGAVGSWAADEVLASKTDIIYSELWENNTYGGVRDFIKYARVNSGKKAVVLAAYINEGEDTGGYFDADTVLLTDAAFFANGAFHLELGDGDSMLAQEFFPARDKLVSEELKVRLREYYNFITAYEQLLFAPALRFGDGGLQWISVAGYNLSGDGAANTLWFLNRGAESFELFHLINLLNNDNQWRNIANTPTILQNISVKLRLGPDADISGVYIASPDVDGGIMQPISYTAGSDGQGDYVTITLPRLEYWDMIHIERTLTTPANNGYEAERAILWNTSVNTNHGGYSGGGFVDRFAEVNDSVNFYVATPQTGNYTFRFRYANGGSAATRSLIVNGDIQGDVDFNNTGNWNTWNTASKTIYLEAGIHQVTLYYGSWNTGAINLDYLQVQ